MIDVTRLNGAGLVLNADLIESVEATPDTLVCLTTGRKIMVTEPVDEIVRRAIAYRAKLRGAYPVPIAVDPDD